MHAFHSAILSVVPEFYKCAFEVTDKDIMCELFRSIFSCKYNRPIEFNTGIGNDSITSITKLENDDFLMDFRQLNIRAIWGLLTDNLYDDILLLEIGKTLPYTIEGNEYYNVGVIEKKHTIPYEQMASGYVRYNGNVHKVSDLDIQDRFVVNDYRVIAIAPFHSCTILEKNDIFLNELQKVDTLKAEDIFTLRRKIHMKRADDVSMML